MTTVTSIIVVLSLLRNRPAFDNSPFIRAPVGLRSHFLSRDNMVSGVWTRTIYVYIGSGGWTKNAAFTIVSGAWTKQH